MTLQEMVDAIKNRPDFDKVGMLACHNGVVRATSREGRHVRGLEIEADHARLEEILLEMNGRKGIIQVAVHLFEGYRQVGEDVVFAPNCDVSVLYLSAAVPFGFQSLLRKRSPYVVPKLPKFPTYDV